MSVALALWHFLPWYTWPLLVVAVIVLIEVPGALAGAIKVAKLVPRQLYVAGAVLIAAGLWLQWHDDGIRADDAKHEATALAARDSYWKGREDKSNAAHAAAVQVLQLKLSTALNTARAAAAAHAAQLKAERAKRQAVEAELEKARSTNVTPEADAACTLTAGVVRQFNLAAAGANGDDPAAVGGTAGPGSEPANARAEIALSIYARAVEDTQRALGACRSQVTGWQTYHAAVIAPWIASTLEALQSCIPKGTP